MTHFSSISVAGQSPNAFVYASPVPPLSRNRRTRLAGAALLLLTACSTGPHPESVYFFEAKLDPSTQDFGRELSSVTGEPLVAGNRCGLLVNGDAIFGAMLEAIRNARATINIETYIFQSDATGTRFARAIEERARAGVHCRVLVDAWGSHTLSKTLETEMKKAGVEFERFRPILLFHRLKNRTHRKLLSSTAGLPSSADRDSTIGGRATPTPRSTGTTSRWKSKGRRWRGSRASSRRTGSRSTVPCPRVPTTIRSSFRSAATT
jgi:hypothetical protein